MKEPELKYIENFLQEVEALYSADSGDNYPQYLMDMLGNIRQMIIKEYTDCDIQS